MARTLNRPKPTSGFSSQFRVSKAKHFLRVFAFDHDDEMQLAAVNCIHFVGGVPRPCMGEGCEHCQEAVQSGDKMLRQVTRYPMWIVDTQEAAPALERFDAPTTAYKRILALLEDQEWEDILGNNGMDFILTTNKNAPQPQDVYTVAMRLKGSPKIEIAEEPGDLITEVDADRTRLASGNEGSASEPAGTEAESPDAVRFTDHNGHTVDGKDTGKRRGEKIIVEVDGRLCQVSPEQIIGSASNESKFSAGDEVSFPYEGQDLIGVITSVNDGDADVQVGNEEFTVGFDELVKLGVDTESSSDNMPF